MLSLEPFDVPLWSDFERTMAELTAIGRKDLAARLMEHQGEVREFERRMWRIIELYDAVLLELDASEWERMERLGEADQGSDESPQRSRGDGCDAPSPAHSPLLETLGGVSDEMATDSAGNG